MSHVNAAQGSPGSCDVERGEMRKISIGDALRVLDLWKNRMALMEFLRSFISGEGSFMGFVTGVEESGMHIQGSGSRADFRFCLAGASFEYGDREDPSWMRFDRAHTIYLGCLAIVLPTGERLAFVEVGGEL
jgi:hypothetical protein